MGQKIKKQEEREIPKIHSILVGILPLKPLKNIEITP